MSTESPIVPIAGGLETLPPSGQPPKVSAIAMGERGVNLASIDDAFRFANAIVKSGMAPKDFATPEKVLVAIQAGAEVGLPPWSALQSIAVINGRATLYGDVVPGIVNASGLMEEYKQEMIGTIGSDDWGACVTVKRKNRSDPIRAIFTVAHAKKAGLWGKSGPWTSFPDRMLLMRARTFALRDGFNDVLKGMVTFEEQRDIPERNVTGSAGLEALQ